MWPESVIRLVLQPCARDAHGGCVKHARHVIEQAPNAPREEARVSWLTPFSSHRVYLYNKTLDQFLFPPGIASHHMLWMSVLEDTGLSTVKVSSCADFARQGAEANYRLERHEQPWARTSPHPSLPIACLDFGTRYRSETKYYGLTAPTRPSYDQ